MGGDYSHELIVEHAVGESRYVVSEDGLYCAHEDIAEFKREDMNADEALRQARVVEARRGPTIADGVTLYGEPSWRQIKTLLYVTDAGERVLVALRGDLEVSEAKLLRVIECNSLRLATEEEVLELGSVVGFVSPLRLAVRKVGDLSLTTVRNFITGADMQHYDTVDVNYGRDFQVDLLADIAAAQTGCRTLSGQVLHERRGVEVGNIFQLGTWYSDRMKGASYTASDGTKRPFYMGCYGLGIGRTIATIAEVYNDALGLLWPAAAAPYDVHLIQLGSDSAVQAAAENVYQKLSEKGQAVLFDDRSVSAGVKFSDADLIGIPERIIVSRRLLPTGQVELQRYRACQKREVGLAEL
jgi:prolyl-tRNA synthetase